MPQIERCPFCGSELTGLHFEVTPFQRWRVKCTLCEARGPVSDNEQVAIYKWNERAILPPRTADAGAAEATEQNRAAGEERIKKYRENPPSRGYPPHGGG